MSLWIYNYVLYVWMHALTKITPSLQCGQHAHACIVNCVAHFQANFTIHDIAFC